MLGYIQVVYVLNYVVYQLIAYQHLMNPIQKTIAALCYVWLLNISFFTFFPIVLFLRRWPRIDYQTVIWGAMVVWNHPILTPSFLWLL